MALVEARIERPVAEAPSAISVKNVLFATDFSPTSEAATPYAAAICRRFGATLHLAHILSDAGLILASGGVDYVSLGTIYEDTHNEVREKLEQLSTHFEGIPHRNHVRHGQIWKNLSRIAEENEIDLIVVGTHGRSGLGKLLLGSVAEDILRHASCPVLTVGPKVSGRAKLPAFHNHSRDLAPPELDIRHILVATNFAGCAERIARQAVLLAEEFRSRISLLHVIEDYSGLGREAGPIEDCIRRLQSLIPNGAALQYPAETVLEFGSAPEGILKVAGERETDMIILGARALREVGMTHLPWSSAHHVIAQAHCPVLTIRE